MDSATARAPVLPSRLRAAWLRFRPHRGPAVVFAVLFLLGHYVFFHAYFFHRPAARVDLDGRYYYAYLTSAWKDHDLDFTNQFHEPGYALGSLDAYPRGAGGRPGNPFSIGPALLWSPFFAAADIDAHLQHHFDPSVSLDGYSELYQHTTLYGTLIYGLLALILTYAIVRRRTGTTLACLAAVCGIVGGPIAWYATGQPSECHAQVAFAAALFFYLWDPARRGIDDPPSLARSAAAGLVLGLAAEIRYVDVALCLLPLGEALLRVPWRAAPVAARAPRLTALRREAVPLAVMAAAALVAFLPQMIAWKIIYGRFLTVPQGTGFMHWTAPSFGPLFSTCNGLFPWAPLWWIAAFFGLPLWLHRERRVFGVALFFAFLVFFNGAARDWWGGLAVGGRRFSELSVFMAVALSCVFQSLSQAVERNPRRAAQVGLVAGAGAMLVFTLGLVRAWAHDAFSMEAQSLPWPELASASASEVAAVIDDQVGDPLSWPANLSFALRYHTAPARYDVAGGRGLDFGLPPAQTLRFTDPLARRCLTRGFGENPIAGPGSGDRPGGGASIQGSPACLLVPVVERRNLDLTIELSLSAPGRLRWTMNGETIGEAQLQAGVQTLRGEAAVDRGANELCIVALTSIDSMRPVLRQLDIAGL